MSPKAWHKVEYYRNAVIDRNIAESIAEFKAGKGYGPFDTHAAFLRALHKQAKRPVGPNHKKRA